MVLESNERSFPGYFKYLPVVASFNGMAFGNNIYLREEIYYDLLSGNPSTASIATYVHERKHLQRFKEVGFLRFAIKYLFSKEFRFQEELIAFTESMRVYKTEGKIVDIASIVLSLSGSAYFHAVSYERALKELFRAYKNIPRS